MPIGVTMNEIALFYGKPSEHVQSSGTTHVLVPWISEGTCGLKKKFTHTNGDTKIYAQVSGMYAVDVNLHGAMTENVVQYYRILKNGSAIDWSERRSQVGSHTGVADPLNGMYALVLDDGDYIEIFDMLHFLKTK